MTSARKVRTGHLVLPAALVWLFLAPTVTAAPLLVYSTYLGGTSRDDGADIEADTAGNVYVGGSTSSSDFPVVGPLQPYAGGTDCYVSKVAPDGSSLIYSTFIGGSRLDRCVDLAVAASGSAFAVGGSDSTDFPLVNPFQASNHGADVVVFRIDPAGSALVYSTYLGGAFGDEPHALAIDSLGSAYLTGRTRSSDFPTASPFQAATNNPGFCCEAFVTKLSPDGASLAFSTYLGGTAIEEGYAIAVHPGGDVLLTGITDSTDFPTRNPLLPYAGKEGSTGGDAFVTRLDADGSALVYSTYLGGRNDDNGEAIAVDGDGNAYIAGFSDSPDFPRVNPISTTPAGFLTKLDPAGGALVYSTSFGGAGSERFFDVAVDACGNAFLAGHSDSAGYPLKDPIQATIGGQSDAVVTVIDASGTQVVFSTFLGGSEADFAYGVAAIPAGLLVTGTTSSANFPVLRPGQPALAGESDAFLTRIDLDLDCCPGVVPGPVGNTLHVVRDAAATTLTFTWTGVAGATTYSVWQDTVKSGPLATLTGSPPAGTTELVIPLPAEPLLFYRVAGGNCAGEGPK